MQDGFVAFDRELRYTYVNERAEVMLHRKADELVGRRVSDVFPDIIGKPIHFAIRRVLETGEVEHVEEYSDGLEAWIDARLYPAPRG